jgi:hypothetical protein
MADQPPPRLRRRLLGMRPSDFLALSPSARENAYHPHVLLVIKCPPSENRLTAVSAGCEIIASNTGVQ